MTNKKKTDPKKTKPYTFFKPREWYALLYLELGKKRSIDALTEQINTLHPDEKHPSLETLRDWCKHQKWRRLAALHDHGHGGLHPTLGFFSNTPNTSDSLQILEKMILLNIKTITQNISEFHKYPPEVSISYIEKIFELSFMAMKIQAKFEALHDGDTEYVLLEKLTQYDVKPLPRRRVRGYPKPKTSS